MVIRLKPGANQNLHLFVFQEIVLHSFNIAMHIDIAYIGFPNILLDVFVMDGTWVCKPAPCASLAHNMPFIWEIGFLYLCQQSVRQQTPK